MTLLDSMSQTALLLDQAGGHGEHQKTMAMAYERILNPDQTPSARVLQEMRDGGIPFWQLALKYSKRWHSDFLARPLEPSEFAEFQTASAVSLRQQVLLEQETGETFSDYLRRFYSQYHQSEV